MKLKLMIAGALAAGMALAGTPSHAAVIVATPGVQTHGVYGQSVVPTGTEVTYINIDALGQHNVVSDATKAGAAWCGTGKPFPNTNAACPVFYSGATIAAGETSAVSGTAGLAAGTYTFYCQPHPNMKGTLTVV